MHLRHLLIQNCKLMRQLEVPFVREDGAARLWTVFVGENGTCKTTLLRAVAMAAAGSAFANHLVADPAAYVDLRRSGSLATIDASFGFSTRTHGQREYPKVKAPGAEPPEVVSRTEIGATSVTFRSDYGTGEHRDGAIAQGTSINGGISSKGSATSAPSSIKALDAGRWPVSAAVEAAIAAVLEDDATAADRAAKAVGAAGTHWSTPIDDARNQDLPHWFVAGYGVGRILSVPQSLTEGTVPKRDRLKSLFDARYLPLGTAFSDRLAAMFGEDRARAFAGLLRSALIEFMHTPGLSTIELRGRGGANNQISLIEAHRFGMAVGDHELKLPAVWLSQGYQAVISLVADIIGNVWLEAGEEVALEDMEGIVLVDELDLHLHPTWQTQIVAGLKATFPRMQFIVTTHSPLVLAGCRADEVWVLKQDPETGDVTAACSDVEPRLLTGSELNRDFFGVERVSRLSEELRRYVELASNPFRSDAQDAEARTLLQALRSALSDPETIVYEPVPRKNVS
jgi:hypothetical protein